MMQAKTSGGDAVVAKLRNIAEKVPDAARKTMRREADNIIAEARLNAPVDTHRLERAIHKEVNYEFRGRLAIDVVVGGVVSGVDVTQYAVYVHEHYEDMTPGQATLVKRAANPNRYIGSKFLERAVDASREKLAAKIIAACMKEID